VFASNRGGRTKLFVAGANGTNQRLLLPGPGSDFAPEWRREVPLDVTLEAPVATGSDAYVCTKVGTPGRDVLVGGGGPDVICGLGGADLIRGGGGNDVLDGGGGRDRLVGGPGRDLFITRDGVRDRLEGGAGLDSARADRRDELVSVERSLS